MKADAIVVKNLSPYEVRLELLKMAKDMLESDYFGRREVISNDWATKVENARHAGASTPEHPGYPPYPSEADIITKAQSLNSFVSQIPQDTKTSTKK
jgi:hypothetical protein